MNSNTPKKESKKEKLKAYGKLFQGGISMLVCLAILLYSAFAWFAQAKNVTARGMSISLKESGSLWVTAKSLADKDALTVDGVDTNENADRLFQLYFDAETLATNEDDGASVVGPGSTGKFTAYITAGDATVRVGSKVCPGGIVVTRDDAGNVLSYTGVESYRETLTTENKTAAEKAVEYMQGHILLFTNRDENKVYSGWVDPLTESTSVSVTPNEETPVEFYWIWIDAFSKLNTGSSIIATADLEKIQTAFFADDSIAQKYLLDPRANQYNSKVDSELQKSHYFDFADEDIGVMVNSMYFEMSFSA